MDTLKNSKENADKKIKNKIYKILKSPIMSVIFSIILCIVFLHINLLSYAANAYSYDSNNVNYDNTTSQLTSVNLQNAIDELYSKIDFLDDIYPIGSLYISVSSTNPGTLFGGTWAAFGSGRTLVGMGSNGTNNYTTVAATGGAVTHSITVSNLPAHNHSIPALSGSTTAANNVGSTTTDGAHTHQFTTFVGDGYVNNGAHYGIAVVTMHDTTDNGSHSHKLNIPSLTVKTNTSNTNGCTNCSGTALNTQDPYITVYMWKRTA